MSERRRAVRPRNERGAASVEAVLVIPAVMLLLGLLLVGGRIWYVNTAVDEAAWTAARSASLERNADAAERAARTTADEQLTGSSGICADAQLQIDTRGLTQAVGSPAAVSVTVRCRVPLADLLVPGVPGHIDVSSSGTSVIDRYRGRS